MKHTILAATLIASSHSVVFAEELDPSDLTKTFTQLSIGGSNKGDAKLMGSVSHILESGTALMGTLEATVDQEGEYSDSRFQYYHVLNVDNSITPRWAGSLDIIDNSLFTTANIGAATVFKTGLQGFDIYARAGYVQGVYSDDFQSMMGINDDSNNGYMGGIYFSYAASNGMYVQYFPEYMKLNGDADFTNQKNTIQFGAPINDSKSVWMTFKYENIQNTMESTSQKIETDDNAVWGFVKFYF
ncbi:hypothetical protein L1D22_11675 [Vibrio sp. Isolate34]|uniref:hypothetical protein n=1 Tax=Vibrio sp. Isolate34 TaxID=2908540 RepID=UPI001EFEAE3D|nr:hypothetical protein [Vibrio sp. Isolate34]MCG9640549.1 hypothetical protein [Vibrio sp. Isolate34]